MEPTTMYQFDASISSAGHTDDEHAATSGGRPSSELLGQMQRYWNAVNYLTVAQIYLRENPLLPCAQDCRPRSYARRRLRGAHRAGDGYARDHFDDEPEIRDWVWTD